MFNEEDEIKMAIYSFLYKYIRKRVRPDGVVVLDGSFDGENWVEVSRLKGEVKDENNL